MLAGPRAGLALVANFGLSTQQGQIFASTPDMAKLSSRNRAFACVLEIQQCCPGRQALQLEARPTLP